MTTTITDAGDTRVNTYTVNDQSAPAIASLPDGFVVVWQSMQAPADYTNTHYAPGYDLYMQRYAADGTAIGGETHVNTVAINDQVDPVIAATADGGYTVAWASAREHGVVNFDYGVYFQRFDALGNAVGSETQANSYYALDQERPGIAALGNGQGFVVTWWSDVQSQNPPGLYARHFGADGVALGEETRIGAGTAGPQSDCSVAALANGGYVLAWDGVGGVYTQRFDANGIAAGAQKQVDDAAANGQSQPVVAALADGGFVVAWQSVGNDGTDIHMQRFGADGSAAGTQLRVNTGVTGEQLEPTVTAMHDGGFVIGWDSADGDGDGIFAQRFDAFGHAVGTESRINDTTLGEQHDVALAAGNDGFIAAWTSIGQDGSAGGVYATAVHGSGASGALPDSTISANVIDTGIVPASTADVRDFSVTGRDVTITTAQTQYHFVDVERVRFDNALFALDTQAPQAGQGAGHVWQAEALLWAGLGTAPGASLVSQWTAEADHASSMGNLAQAMIDFYAPGVSTEALVVHLYTTLAHVAPSAGIVQSFVDQVGAGKAFATQGELFAAAASLSINTDHFADLVGTVVPLDMGWFD